MVQPLSLTEFTIQSIDKLLRFTTVCKSIPVLQKAFLRSASICTAKAKSNREHSCESTHLDAPNTL